MTIEQAIKRALHGWYGVSKDQLIDVVGLMVDEDHNPDEIVDLLDEMENCAAQQTHCSCLLEDARSAVQKAESELIIAEKAEKEIFQHFGSLVAKMWENEWPNGVPGKIIEESVDEDFALDMPLRHTLE